MKYWFLAARPKTLVAALVPVSLATVLAYLKFDNVYWYYSIVAAACALLIQISTNYFNDAIDFHKGTDTHERIGPERMVQSGNLSAKAVLLAAFLCEALALIIAYPLIKEFGWGIVVVGGACLIFSYCYTGGPYPLAYHALGEVFVFIFFGLIAVMGTFYLQAHHLSIDSLILGSQVGLLACVLISINNLRDINQDRMARKNTLAVLLGLKKSRLLIAVLNLTPYFLGLYWLATGYLWLFLMPVFLLPFSIKLLKNLIQQEPSRLYNRYLAHSALQMLIFSLLFIIGICLEKF